MNTDSHGFKITLTSSEYYELSGFRFEGLASKTYVAFDLEGTGPDAEQDSVTQIGAVRLDGAENSEEQVFESLVRSWKPIPEKIEALTGVTNERVKNAPDFADAFDRFRAFYGGAVLVTQCGYEYDYPLLDRECGRAGVPALRSERLDTKAIFALLHPERTETFSTDFLSDYYRIDRSAFKRHDALDDARLIARIFQAELAEAKARGMDTLIADGVMVKRFVVPPR